MRDLPKLSELEAEAWTPSSKSSQDMSLLTTEEMESLRVSQDYNAQMNSKKTEIVQKITHLEQKLAKHSLKEGMLDKIISQTYIEMEGLTPNEFTRRGQKQTILIKQLEALSLLQDTLMKYEDMIQKYHKIVMDIENNKLNSFVKLTNLKKEEKVADEGIGAVLMELQEALKQGGSGVGGNPMLDDITKELSDKDY